LTNYYRERPPHLPRKRKTGTTSQGSNAGESSSKANNTVELLSIILQSQTDRSLKSLSLIFIDNCLKICVAGYRPCVPPANGNLVVTCASSQQMKTFASCTSLRDGKQSVPVIASLRQRTGAKGAIYGVPLDQLCPTCGPAEGFVWPCLGFRCRKSNGGSW